MNEYLEWLNKATVLFLCLCIHTQMTCIFVFMYSRNENIKEPVQCVWCRSYFSNLADIPSPSRAGLSSSLFWTLSPLPALFLRYNHLFLVFIIPSGNEGEIIRLDLHNIHILPGWTWPAIHSIIARPCRISSQYPAYCLYLLQYHQSFTHTKLFSLWAFTFLFLIFYTYLSVILAICFDEKLITRGDDRVILSLAPVPGEDIWASIIITSLHLTYGALLTSLSIQSSSCHLF